MSKPKINDLEFAERLNLILKNRFNDNKSEFARAIDIAITSLNRWLEGEADPSRSNLVKTAKAAGVSLEWLATCAEESSYITQTLNTEGKSKTPTIEEAFDMLRMAIIHNHHTLTDKEARLLADFRACSHDNRQAIMLMAKNGAELASHT